MTCINCYVCFTVVLPCAGLRVVPWPGFPPSSLELDRAIHLPECQGEAQRTSWPWKEREFAQEWTRTRDITKWGSWIQIGCQIRRRQVVQWQQRRWICDSVVVLLNIAFIHIFDCSAFLYSISKRLDGVNIVWIVTVCGISCMTLTLIILLKHLQIVLLQYSPWKHIHILDHLGETSWSLFRFILNSQFLPAQWKPFLYFFALYRMSIDLFFIAVHIVSHSKHGYDCKHVQFILPFHFVPCTYIRWSFSLRSNTHVKNLVPFQYCFKQ